MKKRGIIEETGIEISESLAKVEKELSEKKIIEDLNRIGVDNKGLIRRTLTALVKKKRLLRSGDKYKGFSYSLPPTRGIQRKLDHYLT